MEWKRRNPWLLSSFLGLSLIACGGGTPGGSGSGKCSGLNAGDIIITEIMANPKGSDKYQEYVEIYNPTSNPIDLNGVKVFISKDDGSNEKSKVTLKDATVQPGQYFTIGDFSDAVDEETGIAPTPYSHLDYTISKTFSITNNDARLGLRCGETILDEVTWAKSKEGYALILSGNKLNAADHSSATNWCNIPAEDSYSIPALTKTDENGKETTSYGTPQQANPDCSPEDIQVTVDAGTCLDNGVPRPINYPSAGDLVINEIMSWAKDTDSEYIELYAVNSVDLNELIVSKGSGDWKIESNDCMTVTAGQYIVIARSADATVNGGLPQVDVVLSKMDINQSGTIYLLLDNSTEEAPAEPIEIDSVEYSKSSQMNISMQRSSDMSDTFCESTSIYSSYDVVETGEDGSSVTNTMSMYGTPGSANAECPKQAGDGQCMDNGVPRNIVMPEEGDLLITEVMSHASKDKMEYIELYATASFDLNGVLVSKGSGDWKIESDDCMTVTAGQYIVIARSADETMNGDLPQVDVVISGLNPNQSGTISLLVGETSIDSVTYEKSTRKNASMQRSSDMSVAFCESTSKYADFDIQDDTGATTETVEMYGTPGRANDVECPEPPVELQEGQCLDNGVARAIVMPSEGDLLITEVMSVVKLNGATSNNKQMSYVEIYANRSIDLNGVALRKYTTNQSSYSDKSISSDDCLRINSGDYVVLAKTDDVSINGGLTDVLVLSSLDLNKNGRIELVVPETETSAEVIVDSVEYTNYADNYSSQRSSDMSDNFCQSTASYANGLYGTPGTANAQCAAQ